MTALLDELKRDRAVVVVSHDVEEIQPITDRAFRMTTHGALTDVSDELAGARARVRGGERCVSILRLVEYRATISPIRT